MKGAALHLCISYCNAVLSVNRNDEVERASRRRYLSASWPELTPPCLCSYPEPWLACAHLIQQRPAAH